MKRVVFSISTTLVLCLLIIIPSLISCNKPENPIKYQYGTFSDSVYNLTGLNTQYDDYNSNIYAVGSSLPIIFSSNRGSSGGQFDLVQGVFGFLFDQGTGVITISSEMINDPFYTSLIKKANTSGNDFGPYSIFSSTDGFEYFLIASQNDNQLDLYYLKNLPLLGTSIPEITGPFPVKFLNSLSNDAYIAFDLNADSVYFTSDRGGNFDIYLTKRNSTLPLDSWFNQNFAASAKVDSVNSSSDDKCPFIFKNIMIFSSNRPEGLGGYDLYYSKFKNGKWNSPVNLGPKINSSSDEYRPLMNYHPDFTNRFIVFSSNKSGGKGGFDLYFSGVEF